MSGIKTLFEKQKQAISPNTPVQVNTVEDLIYDVETADYITQYGNSQNLYLQDVNFATASNFAKFGSARKYYENIVNRITQYFPYDGSKAEQLKFENNLNPFEKYIYLYQYPRSTGYVDIAGSSWGTRLGALKFLFGLPTSQKYISFYNQNNDNVYNSDYGLRENTRFIFSTGSTVEFWLKKNSFPDIANQTNYEAVFYTKTIDNDKRFFIYLDGSNVGKIGADYEQSDGAGGTITQFNFSFDTGLATIADSTWHHYALTFYHSGSNYYSDFYFDGTYKQTKAYAVSPAVDITGSAFCTVGALGGQTFDDVDMAGYGKLSGSLDEFRFWNVKRDAKQIGLNYFTNVGGGNDLTTNNGIGVYYKFNEGITGNDLIDSRVLDYAGRNCNGRFTNYTSAYRNTGSAITDTQEKAEKGSPIVYYNHPDIQTFLTDNLVYADEYDFTNNFALKNSLPSWILDDDANNGDILVNFLQTMASYLDTLYLQTTTYKNLKNKEYLNYEGKAPPFSDLLLTSNGFDLPALFLNTDIVQSFLNQDNKKTYDEKIADLKNIIYKNIYNNLDIIYKSKGTENSIKQLIKNFGIDKDVYNLNIYANNTQYALEDSYVNKYIKKDAIDFTPFKYSANSNAVIYQSGSNSFITGTTGISMSFTAECDFIIPKFPITYDKLTYETKNYNASSVFGIRTANNTQNDLTVPGGDVASLKAGYYYRDDKGYFTLYAGTRAATVLSSSVFPDTATDQHWNLSFKLSPISGAYNLVFSGYSNFVSDQFREFSVSASLTIAEANDIFSNNKRVYVGAERINITGGRGTPAIIKPLSVRYWADELTSEELKDHARNPNNYGRLHPNEPYILATSSYIPKAESLILYWDFSNITDVDSSGEFGPVYNVIARTADNSVYNGSPLQNFKGKTYNGRCYGFEPSTTIKYKELVYASEQQVPENLYSSQLIDILESDDDYYTTTIKPQKYFFAIENSMYDVISKNMLNLFATILEFNNLIGEPANMYKQQYSKLKQFRKYFYGKVFNQPDLDTYVGIYKWIDDALDSILFNLLPASANASEKVRTIVENHVLERSKIQYPLLPDRNLTALGQFVAYYQNAKCPVYFGSLKDLNYKSINGYIPPDGGWANNFNKFKEAVADCNGPDDKFVGELAAIIK